MNPIFNEYLTFLRDTSGKELSDLKEGYFRLDNQIIKGFDKHGNIYKFYRIFVSDDIKLAINKPKMVIQILMILIWQVGTTLLK